MKQEFQCVMVGHSIVVCEVVFVCLHAYPVQQCPLYTCSIVALHSYGTPLTGIPPFVALY